MLEFTKQFDILSINTKLYTNGNESLKTKVGGILSIAIIILGITGFLFYLSKIITRSELSVSLNKIYTPESIYYLNTSNSIFAFRIADRFGNVVNDTYYSAVAQNWKYFFTKDENGINKISYNFDNLKVSRCENIKINSTEFNTVYSKFDVSRHWCLDPGQIIEIKNPYGGSIDYSYINIYFTHCTHLGDQCEKPDKIDNYLTSYLADIFFTSYYVDNYNYDEPLQPYIYTFSEFSSSAYFKRIFYEIKTLYHISDDGIVLPESKERSKVSFENYKNIIDFRNSNINGGKVLFQFSYIFNTNGFKETYHRSYKKIQNLLAEIGGFLNFIKLMCFSIMVVYTDIIYIPLIYQGYSLYLDENLNNKINSSSIQILNKNKKISYFENIRNSMSNANMDRLSNPRHTPNSEKEFRCDIKKSSFPSKKEILRNYIPFCKNKIISKEFKIFLAAKKKLIFNYLNVSSLIRVQNELCIIKHMLLKSKKDENQFNSAVSIVRLSENEKKHSYIDYQIENDIENNFFCNIEKYLKDS
jgi:hypothetical protein